MGRDLNKIIIAKGFKKLPLVNKSPNLGTLPVFRMYVEIISNEYDG